MQMGTRKLEVGHACIYHDEYSRPLPALVTAVHGDDWDEYVPSLNVVFVSPDPKRQDGCGRQTEHASSVVHKSNAGTPGHYWRFADEEPIPYSPPAQT
jgi:hypothetical protein